MASKRFVVVLFLLLLTCLNVLTIEKVSAQKCSGTWDILNISGMKSNYEPKEIISCAFDYRLSNSSDCPKCVQQLVVGIVDEFSVNVKDSYPAVAYHGIPKVCPEDTSGPFSRTFQLDLDPGTYHIVVCNYNEFFYQESLKNFPAEPNNTKVLKEITVGVSTPPLPQPPDTQPTPTPTPEPTPKPTLISQWIKQNLNTILSVIAVLLIVYGLIRYCTSRRRSKLNKIISLIIVIIAAAYLVWIYIVPPILACLKQNIVAIVLALIAMVAILVVILTRRNPPLPPPPSPEVNGAPSCEEEGYVYIMRCPSHEADLYKIGRSKTRPEKRTEEMSSPTGVPEPYILYECWKVANHVQAELLVHKALEKYRINPKREFFKARLEIIIPIIKETIKDKEIANQSKS